MTDMDMKKVIRGNQLDKRRPYTEEYFREEFASELLSNDWIFFYRKFRIYLIFWKW